MKQSSTARLYLLLSSCKPEDKELKKCSLIEMIRSNLCSKEHVFQKRYSFLYDNYYNGKRLQHQSVDQLEDVLRITERLEEYFSEIEKIINRGNVNRLKNCMIHDLYSYKSFAESFEKILCIEKKEKNFTNISVDNLWEIFNGADIKTKLNIKERKDITKFLQEYKGLYSFTETDYRHALDENKNYEKNRKERKRALFICSIVAIVIVIGFVFQQYQTYKENIAEYNQAEEYLSKHQWDKARKKFKELGAFRDAEERYSAIDGLEKDYYVSKMDEIISLSNEGNYQEAYNRIDKNNPYYGDYIEQIDTILIKYIEQLINAGDTWKAFEVLDNLSKNYIENNKDNYNYIIGRIYYENEEYDKAAEAFELISENGKSKDVIATIDKNNKKLDEIEKEEQYSEAEYLLNHYNFKEAKKVLKKLGDYKNSKEVLKLIENEISRIGYYKQEDEEYYYVIVQVKINMEEGTAKYIFDNLVNRDLEESIEYYEKLVEKEELEDDSRIEESRDGNIINIIDDDWTYEFIDDNSLILHKTAWKMLAFSGEAEDEVYHRVKGL